MQSFSSRRAITSEATWDEARGAIAPFPGLAGLQTQSFLILTNRSWETLHGPMGCLPFKIFGWNPQAQDFTLCLFDASFSDLENYAEFDSVSNELMLYQSHPEAQICYIYQPYLEDTNSTYPTQYELRVLISADGENWEVVAEGEYR
ncbi:hypothetical protein [Pseudanabaena sp. FACHB-2040]|uniref:hypothetical protein n=1 Tax=Pseudanabaena sp. FACHB-2040 TaxID=2692859 RepID=UPI0016890BFC|nr:hypothetical protein [Pseudanabaena sp. FACHB-2040]MBD2258954.1 hypothetical protein [Pseudanabaena sp. FACHB-2040]